MCAVPCAALSPIRTLFAESSRRTGVLLSSGQNPLLCYSQHGTTNNCMQICMGTERKGQVGRAYWQVAMRYNVHSIFHTTCCESRCRLLAHRCSIPLFSLLHAVRCLPRAACCTLRAAGCMPLAVRVCDAFCGLHATYCSLFLASCSSYVCCMLYAVSSLVCAACCLLPAQSPRL